MIAYQETSNVIASHLRDMYEGARLASKHQFDNKPVSVKCGLTLEIDTQPFLF